jgi:hypothetical protein
MKTFGTLLLLITIIHSLANSQNVEIPDTAFLYALIDEGVDTNGDSLISNAEAEIIISLDMNERGIVDMTGIEAFVLLDTLDCSDNSLTSLDLSNNKMLRELKCTQNNLTSLEVTNNDLLEWLHCWNNELTSLDVSSNTALKALYIQGNQIDKIDVANNTGLRFLRCRGNQLAHLDVTNNTSLTSLSIDEMPTLVCVSVWVLPFPPEGVNVDTTDSPNVVFTTEDCSGVGVVDYSHTGLSIYPNPASSILTIETNRSDQYNIEIISLNGQLLFSDIIEGPTHQIDLSSFQKGLFFITIKSREFVRTEKIIKL